MNANTSAPTTTALAARVPIQTAPPPVQRNPAPGTLAPGRSCPNLDNPKWAVPSGLKGKLPPQAAALPGAK
jgi:hypothetical protein